MSIGLKKRDGTQIRLGFNRNTWYLDKTKSEDVKKQEALYHEYLNEVVFDYNKKCCSGSGPCYKTCENNHKSSLCHKRIRRGYQIHKEHPNINTIDIVGKEDHTYIMEQFRILEKNEGKMEISFEEWLKSKNKEEDANKDTIKEGD